MRETVLCVLVAWSIPAAVSAQRPAPPIPPSATTGKNNGAIYDSEGRRDPFVSPLPTAVESRLPAAKVDGPAGLAVNEILLRGIIQSRGALIAMVQGPDKKTYLMHQGDKFVDGTIKEIDVQGLVIVQAITDPLSPVKQREIRKPLRSTEDVKP